MLAARADPRDLARAVKRAAQTNRTVRTVLLTGKASIMSRSHGELVPGRHVRSITLMQKQQATAPLITSAAPSAAAAIRPLSTVLENITVGVLGGSITSGEGVKRGSRWVDVLGRLLPGVRVLNRAVRATGVAHAAFCLDALLPEPVSAIVVEYAVNDGWYRQTSSLVPVLDRRQASRREPGDVGRDALDGIALSPAASMERLLRIVRAQRPGVVVIILYMCRGGTQGVWRNGPGCSKASSWMPKQFNETLGCDQLYSEVAKHYGVREVSLTRQPQTLLKAKLSVSRFPAWLPGPHERVRSLIVVLDLWSAS